METFEILDIMVEDDIEEGYIRIKCKGNIIKYIIIDTNTLGYETPPARCTLAAKLPELPDGNWTTLHLSKNRKNNQLEFHSPEKVELTGIQNLWHPVKVNYFDLHHVKSVNFHVFEVTIREERSPSTTSLPPLMIAKICGFPYLIKYLDKEIETYQKLQGKGIAPEFLGYVTETIGEGIERVVGFLLRKVDGHHALSLSDLPICTKALRKFHAVTGSVHGDANRGNFIVKPDGSEALMIDFTFTYEAVGESMQSEIEGLEECMKEDDESRRTMGEEEFLKDDLRERIGGMKAMTEEEDQRRAEIGLDAWIEEKLELVLKGQDYLFGQG